MSREPIFSELADGLASRVRRRHQPRHAASFQRDLHDLPIFAATVKACGWNGLHVRPQAEDETATFAAVRP